MIISRRQGLVYFAKSTVPIMLGSLLNVKARANPLGLPIGIQLYTVRKAFAADAVGTLRSLAAMGYREVEPAGTAGRSPAEFRKLMDGEGLTCPSAHVGFTENEFGAAFAQAKALGANYATSSMLASLVVSDLRSRNAQGAARTLTIDDFHRMAALMNRIGKAAKVEGLTYAYHNHNIEFVPVAGAEYGFDLLLRETDPATVFFEADCGWMAAAGANPAEYLARFPGRFPMIHVKDFAPTHGPITDLFGSPRPQGVDLGRGFVDYKRIFAAARQTGLRHVFVEQEEPFAHSDMESARIDYEFLASFS